MGPPRCREAERDNSRPSCAMAERRGFEPPSQFYPTNRLAGGCLQPLGHLSKSIPAEGVGFEPTELSLSGFQDRRLKPLGHPSASPPGRRTIVNTRRALNRRPPRRVGTSGGSKQPHPKRQKTKETTPRRAGLQMGRERRGALPHHVDARRTRRPGDSNGPSLAARAVRASRCQRFDAACVPPPSGRPSAVAATAGHPCAGMSPPL